MSARSLLPWILGILALLAAATAGSVFTVAHMMRQASELAQDMVASIPQVQAEAASFAAGHDQADCVTRALQQGEACVGDQQELVLCRVNASRFMTVCLESATPVASLCDGVPSWPEGDGGWGLEQCRERGFEEDPCGMLLFGLVTYCETAPPLKNAR